MEELKNVVDEEIIDNAPVEVESADDSMNESEYSAFDALRTKAHMSDLQKLSDELKNYQQALAQRGGEEVTDIDFIDERIKEHTVEELKKMSDDEIIKLCTDEDGKLYLNDFGTEKESAEYRRDYIVFRKESNEALGAIDDEMLKLEEAYSEYEQDLKDITNKYGDITDYLKSTITKRMEEATDEKAKQRYADMNKTIDMALTLDNVIEYYSNPYRARTAVVNVKAPKSGKTVIKHYEEVLSKVSCKTDFRRFGGLEPRFLPDEYKNKPVDSFMYSMVNYIASLYKVEDKALHGLFLAQFSINLKNLIYDKFTKPSDKDTFIKAICTVLDLVA